MFGKNYVAELIDRSAENPADRRRFLKGASAAGLGLVGAGLLGPDGREYPVARRPRMADGPRNRLGELTGRVT